MGISNSMSSTADCCHIYHLSLSHSDQFRFQLFITQHSSTIWLALDTNTITYRAIQYLTVLIVVVRYDLVSCHSLHHYTSVFPTAVRYSVFMRILYYITQLSSVDFCVITTLPFSYSRKI
jgi:hypothetical protein